MGKNTLGTIGKKKKKRNPRAFHEQERIAKQSEYNKCPVCGRPNFRERTVNGEKVELRKKVYVVDINGTPVKAVCPQCAEAIDPNFDENKFDRRFRQKRLSFEFIDKLIDNY